MFRVLDVWGLGCLGWFRVHASEFGIPGFRPLVVYATYMLFFSCKSRVTNSPALRISRTRNSGTVRALVRWGPAGRANAFVQRDPAKHDSHLVR